jgi:hypothetical protein
MSAKNLMIAGESLTTIHITPGQNPVSMNPLSLDRYHEHGVAAAV